MATGTIVSGSRIRMHPDGMGNRTRLQILLPVGSTFTFTYAELSISKVTAVINAGTLATTTGGNVYFDGTNVAGANFTNSSTVTLIITHA